MICSKCGTENRETAKFCRKCGTPLEAHTEPAEPVEEAVPEKAFEGIKCPACGTDNDESASFCKKCGMPLKIVTAPVKEDPEENEPDEPKPSEPAKASPAAKESSEMKEPEEQPNTQVQYSESIVGKLFKNGFSKPIDAIHEADCDDGFKAGLIFLGAKDLLISMIAAFAMMNTISSLGELFGLSGLSYLTELSSSVSGILFIVTLLVTLAGDALLIFVPFGMGRAFHSDVQLKGWIGSLGTAAVLYGTITVVAMLISAAGVIAGMIVSVPAVAAYYALNWEAFKECMKLEKNKAVWAYLISIVLLEVAILLVLYITGGAIANMVQGSVMNGFGY